ncbi:MAG: MFS transporter [Alphaproteobacteria bacterium]|nr:MFS transporter [Alphaproteobacteria bacterium]
MREHQAMPVWQDWRVLVVGLGTLAVPLDSSVNVAFPEITRGFGLSIPQIQWVVIVYMLAQTSLMMVFGRLGDMVGHRRVFLAGSAWSVLAFVACAAAPTYGWLLAGRIAQGVGAGLLLSCGAALAISLQPEAMRARVLGLYTMLYSLGFALGPAIAGLLVARFDWPAVFWFRAPIALAAFAASWALPAPPRPAAGERFDAAGAALLVLGISMAVLAIDRLQHLADGAVWSVGAACIAAVAFFAFARQERRAPQPLIELRFFAVPGFARLNLAAALVNLACFAVLLLLPFYLARAAGLGAPAIGVMLACSAVGMVIASPLAGVMSSRAGSRALARAGCIAMAAGLAVMAAAPPLAILAPALLVQGFGQGLFQVAFLDIVTGTLPASARGVAGSLGMLTRTIGVVTGASVLTLMFQSFLGSGAGVSASAAFLAAFQGVFAVAAAIPAISAVTLIGRAPRYSA